MYFKVEFSSNRFFFTTYIQFYAYWWYLPVCVCVRVWGPVELELVELEAAVNYHVNAWN